MPISEKINNINRRWMLGFLGEIKGETLHVFTTMEL
jgi:hypothetical protein